MFDNMIPVQTYQRLFKQAPKQNFSIEYRIINLYQLRVPFIARRIAYSLKIHNELYEWSTITRHWGGMGSWNPFPWKTITNMTRSYTICYIRRTKSQNLNASSLAAVFAQSIEVRC